MILRNLVTIFGETQREVAGPATHPPGSTRTAWREATHGRGALPPAHQLRLPADRHALAEAARAPYKAVSALRRGIEDKSAKARSMAVVVVGRLGLKALVAELEKLCLKETDPSVLSTLDEELPISDLCVRPASDGAIQPPGKEMGGEGPVSGADLGQADSSSSTGEGGPQFLSFGTNVTAITEGEMVTFTAVLTDPDGIDDLIGGSLTSPDEVIQYGAMATSGQEGAYSITLSWAQMHAAEAITFTGSVSRVFRAVFYDSKGNKASRAATLKLHCDAKGGSACGGACKNLMTDAAHCGTCGTQVPSFQICQYGAPACADPQTSPCADGCYDLSSNNKHCGSCSKSCAGLPYQYSTCNGGYCDEEVTDEGLSPAFPSGKAPGSCQTLCAADGAMCGPAIYWSQCGQAGAGCFYAGMGSTASQALSCGDVPSVPSGIANWYQQCRCIK